MIPDRELNKWIRSVYMNPEEATIHQPSIMAFAEYLLKALQEGTGVQIDQIDWTTPDANLIREFGRQIYHFAAAKNYNELQLLTSAIIGNDGKVLEWHAFKKLAQSITQEHREVWLKTEYNFAVASSQMASKWREFEQKGAGGILRFRTVRDNRVRPGHRKLEGMSAPVDDPIWDWAYPPLDWQCRCDVDEVIGAAVSDQSKFEMPDIPAMFKTNLAKNKLLFPSNHPYYIGYPKEQFNQDFNAG